MSNTNGKYASVNGLNMYYEVHGTGYPLVLIHGGGSTIGTTFGRVLGALAETNMVIAVELQAHGHTADIDRPLSFEQDADDVAALLKHMGIAAANFFGFSNGGSTTLQIAIRHPELVNKIVVASAMYKKEGTYPWLWEMMKASCVDQMPPQLKDAYIAINPDSKAFMAMFQRDVARMLAFNDMNEADIKGIKAKATLIIAGDADITTPEHAVEMYRNIPSARLAILPGGHGDYIGEITTVKNGHAGNYPAIQIINDFLKG